MNKYLSLVLVLALLAAGCTQPEEQEAIHVFLNDGGEERAVVLERPVTVRELLEEEEIELGPDDRLSPSEFTTVTDGMTITIARISIETLCEDEIIPFDQEILPNEAMTPGEEHLAQAGREGTLRTCYRVETVNGEEAERVQIDTLVIEEPVNEIIFQGVRPPPPIGIEGTLAYISTGSAWLIRSNSANKRPIVNDNTLDGHVFDLSPDGRRLLFTRIVEDEPERFNSLWVILDTRAEEPVAYELRPDNVLYGEWVPGAESDITYSTSDARPTSPGWQAHNNLWFIRLDLQTAESLDVTRLLDVSSGGQFGWWGTSYKWSPDGRLLAWARPDGMGLVNLELPISLIPIFEFPVYNTYSDWAWVPTLSWAPESSLLLTTVHGEPVGGEALEDSPVFHIAVASPDGRVLIEDLIPKAGIWAAPQFSPLVVDEEGNQSGYIAYLQARGSGAVLSDQSYGLALADRDGSNRRILFPERAQDVGLQPQTVAWSPSGEHIAFIYQRDLWIIEVRTGLAQRVTADRNATLPRWVE